MKKIIYLFMIVASVSGFSIIDNSDKEPREPVIKKPAPPPPPPKPSSLIECNEEMMGNLDHQF